MPNAADSIRNPLPFGQNASYLKFYVFDSTSEFGFVFAILSSRWSVHYHQCTDYLQRLAPPYRCCSPMDSHKCPCPWPTPQVVMVATYMRHCKKIERTSDVDETAKN